MLFFIRGIFTKTQRRKGEPDMEVRFGTPENRQEAFNLKSPSYSAWHVPQLRHGRV